MEKLLWIVGATLIDSLLGLAGIFSFFVREATLQRSIKFLVPFSAGVLLGAGFFHLLAEALGRFTPMLAMVITIFGFLIFFVLEEYLHWHHCEECEIHPYTYLMIIGDSLHNVLDGLVIASAFITSIPLGILISAVVIAHEVPQELGIFALLLSGGIEKKQAISYSLLAQVTCILGGVAGFFFMSRMERLASYILPFAAGGFIYIAASDLIPGMHKTEGLEKVVSFSCLCLGLAFMLYLKIVAGI
jgi:zinc and cadmium transporter